MPDVFLSYSREDQSTARRFAEAFEQAGLSVWWDQTLTAGESYDEVTEQALKSAQAVVVLWSRSSVSSRWVRAEATIADRNNTLVPVMIEACERPVMFELRQSADLSTWNGDVKDANWQVFLAGVKRVVKKDRSAASAVAAAVLPTEPPPVAPRDPFRRVRSMLLVAVVLIAVLAGLWLLMRVQGKPAATPTAGPSIAVLPFVNISSDPEQEYFSDGLSEELLNELAQVPDLRVIGRTSSFAFKGKNEDLRKIGELLGVNNILEGSVRKAGDRVRITAQLINPADGSHLWSETYERKLDDIFAIQEEIARSVTRELRLRMSSRSSAMGTRSVAAYDEYLAGRAALSSTLAPGKRAVSRLERAVEIDPEFVTAWIWLVDAYTRLALADSALSDETVRRQEAAIDRIVMLVPDSPEASFALSYRAARGRDLVELERLLRESKSLTGSQGARARFRLAQFLLSVGRIPESIEAFEDVKREEPLDVFMRTNLLLAQEISGQFKKADAEMQDILQLPGAQEAAVLGTAITRAMGQKDPARLRAAIEEAEKLSPAGVSGMASRMSTLLGDPSTARTELHRALDDPEQLRDIYGYSAILQWSAYFGDRDLAIQMLEKLNRQQFSFETWAWILWRPVLGEVRSDPAARGLMQDMGLVDYWRATGNWGDFCKPVGTDDFQCH